MITHIFARSQVQLHQACATSVWNLLCQGAQAVELDSYVIRTVVERLRDGLDLQRQLEQVGVLHMHCLDMNGIKGPQVMLSSG